MVEIDDGVFRGRGEAQGVSYHGESVEIIAEQLNGVAADVRNGVTRSALPHLLAPGGARNALDCALWDIEAKRAGRRAWELIGLTSVRPLRTAYTLGVDDPSQMASAASMASHPLLKLKLNGDDDDIARVTAVRNACPRADLIVDANQAWSEVDLSTRITDLFSLGVSLIEQPLPVGADIALKGLPSPIPICADESCQTVKDLDALLGKYQFVNIKLDKTGGLTAALDLAREAEARGLGLMVGCMAGSSLAMAPAFVVGQFCAMVDLDGPLLAAADIDHGIQYDGTLMQSPDAGLWG